MPKLNKCMMSMVPIDKKSYNPHLLVGCWEEDVIDIFVQFLAEGNEEICADILRTLVNGKNVQYVNKVQY